MALYFFFQSDSQSGFSPQQQPYNLNGMQMTKVGVFYN